MDQALLDLLELFPGRELQGCGDLKEISPAVGREPGDRAQFVKMNMKVLTAVQHGDDLFQELVLGFFLDQEYFSILAPVELAVLNWHIIQDIIFIFHD